VYVTEESPVHVGDPLIQLDTHDLLLKKHALEDRIHLAELNINGNRHSLADLYLELRQTQLNLVRHTITSPADGQIVSVVLMHPGQRLMVGTAIAVIQFDQSIKNKKALKAFTSSAFLYTQLKTNLGMPGEAHPLRQRWRSALPAYLDLRRAGY